MTTEEEKQKEDTMFLDRVKYISQKIKRAWLDKTLFYKIVHFVKRNLRSRAEVIVGYPMLSRADRKIRFSDGFADHRMKPEARNCSPDLAKRLIVAYKAMKEAQSNVVDPAFQIRGLWAEWIDVNYRDFMSALNNEDIRKTSDLLDNLNREQFAVGTGGGYDDYVMYRTSLIGRFHLRYLWCTYRNNLLSLGFSPEDIHFPLVGNPAGVFFNDEVIQADTLRHIYHAIEMRHWLRDLPRSVVVEIGGGLGGQAYQTVRLADGAIAKYVLFDIPEVATIASFFLISAFRDKRIRLFDEGDVSVAPSEEYDIAVFPHFAIPQLESRSVDLFHNSCSFSEMDKVSSTEYLRIIERVCRKYFNHINADTPFSSRNPDGLMSENLIGSKLVPSPQYFKRVFKKPRVFKRPEDRLSPAFEYLYELMQIPKSGG